LQLGERRLRGKEQLTTVFTLQDSAKQVGSTTSKHIPGSAATRPAA
jgi:hypothetical protein